MRAETTLSAPAGTLPAAALSGVLGSAWRMVACLLALGGLLAVACFAQAEDLVGLGRADVLASLGQPQSTLRRGDKELLIYPEGVQVELRGDKVVGFKGGPQAVIVAADGTRFLPHADGRLRRYEEPAAEAAPAAGVVATDAATIPDAAVQNAAPAPEPASATAPAPAEKPATAEEEARELGAISPAVVPAGAMMDPAEFIAGQGTDQARPPPRWVAWVSAGLGLGLHFGIALAVLAVALKIVGLPFYLPDLLKACALYLVVREGLHSVGGLGGAWTFIPLFRIDDGISLLALAVLLFRFKIALSGLTALKVAAATKVATYVLMIGAGLAISFGMMAFY